jgi:D-alanyl-D-alanine carboxypeptidase
MKPMKTTSSKLTDCSGRPHRLAALVTAAGLLVLGACGTSSDATSTTSDGSTTALSPVTDSSARFPDATELDTAIENAMNEASIPGAIVGIWAPDGEYVKTFGVADEATGAPMELDFYHRIGSISKTFTTAALLLLADQGKVSLDDPISKYVPDVPSGDDITLRNLARMSSGLTTYDDSDEFADGYFADPSQSYTPTQVLDYVLDIPAKFEAGSEFSYSNTNTVLIGLVVEEVTGQTLAEFVTDNILVPLNMTHTSYPTTAQIPSPHAQGYTKVGDAEAVATDWNPSWGWAAGNMISTLEDMKIWATELGTGSLLSPETQQERINSNVPWGEGGTYGLGMFDIGGWLGHSGSIFGYQTLVVYLPEQQTSVVFFTNTDAPHSASTTLGKAITEVISPNHVYQ